MTDHGGLRLSRSVDGAAEFAGGERYPDSLRGRKIACQAARAGFYQRHVRPGFLDRESRQDLTELARDGSAAHRLGRRANALVLLDDGMSCEAIAKVLLLDDDTIRTWYRLYEEEGIE
ncbi:MAG: helix-turn-helix domain-containing protein, partial [Acetobacteraceae bacterium]